MPTRSAVLLLATCAALPGCYGSPSEAGKGFSARATAPHQDRYGDPLPSAALARLGTVRLRHPGGVDSVVFSRDGRAVIAATSLASPDRGTRTIGVWEVASGRLLRWLDSIPYGSGCLALSPDGKTLAAVSGGRSSIWVFDLEAGKVIRRIEWEGKGNLLAVGFSPDGKTLASIGYESVIQIWDARTGRRLRHFGHPDGGVNLVYSPDGRKVVSGGDNGIRTWDVTTGKEVWQLPSPFGDFPAPLACSPDGQVLAVGCQDGSVKLVALASGKFLRQSRGHRGAVQAVAFAPDGKLLASGGEDATVRLWDAATGKEVRRLRGHATDVAALAFSPDGKLLASGSGDHSVKLWEVRTGKERFPCAGHQLVVASVAFSPNGKFLASGGYDDKIILWDPASSKEVWKASGCPDVSALAFSPEGKSLVSVGQAGRIRLLEAATGKERWQVQGHLDQIYAVACSPDGKLLASASIDSTVRLWDVGTGKEVRRMEGGTIRAFVTCLAFSPDGRLLGSGREDHTIRLCEVATGKQVRQFSGHEQGVTSVAFAPGGSLLASSSFDATVRLWDATTGKEVRQFKGHEGPVNAVAFAPDGRTLASGDKDGVVRVWETATGSPVRCFCGHTNEVTSVGFSPDGRSVASGSRDFTILVWDVTGLRTGNKRRGQPLDARQLEHLWEALADRDAAEAHRAAWQLVAVPRQAARLLRTRLKPVESPPPQRIARLVAELDAPQFRVRARASSELEKLGEVAGPTLHTALAGRPSAEVRRRANALLHKLQVRVLPPERLRQDRAVGVLEQVGTADARQLLRDLARGASGAGLTEAAQAALQRLAQRPEEK